MASAAPVICPCACSGKSMRGPMISHFPVSRVCRIRGGIADIVAAANKTIGDAWGLTCPVATTANGSQTGQH